MNICPEPETLSQLLSGGLAPDDLRRVSQHLSGCSSCQAVLDQQTAHVSLRRSVAEWQALVSGQDDDPALQRALHVLRASPPEFFDEAAATQVTVHRGETSPLQPGAGGLPEVYHVGVEIGRGGMGVVYRGFDSTLKRTIAIKVLRMELANAEARSRFTQEAQAIAQIRHDHVVAIYAVCNPSFGLPSLVMEYLEGPTLAEVIKRQVRLDPAEAADWISQAAEGLAAVHEAGIIHRDIKPGNLMLDHSAGRVKVMDFGLARHMELPSGLTQPGDLAGTPAYMSPEQVQRAEGIDARTDIYSLGITLYEALTGEPPFRGSTHCILQQIVESPPRPPKQLSDAIPRDIETICLKAISKEPGRRYQTAREFAADLRRWERKEPIHARPVGKFERGWRWCRRKPLVAGLWAGLIVATGAGAMGVVSQWLRAESQWHRAEAKAGEATILQAQSEKDFRRAREAVDKYLTQIADDPDLKAQNFEPLRRRLLQSARSFYEEFIREHPQDDNVSAELGRAHGRIGQIVVLLESRPDSLPHFRKKQEIFERLHAAEPGNPQYVDELADSLSRQAEAHRFMHRMDEAESEYNRALELQQKLAGDHPGNADFMYHLLLMHYKLGDLFLASQKLTRAEQVLADGKAAYDRWSSQRQPPRQLEAGLAYLSYVQGRVYGAQGRGDMQQAALQSAIVLFEKLAESPPDADLYQAALAAALNEMGIMHARARIAVRAEEMWRKSMRINQELARTHPANVSYRAALADGNKNVGTLALFEQNQPETAAVALRDASAVYERLEHDFPETLYYGNNLLVSWQTLAFVYEHLNQFSHALDLADHVLGHLETRFPENQRDDRFRTLYLEWLGLRARVLRRLDRLDEALDVCDRALKVVNDEKRHDWERFREIVTAFSLLQEGEPQRAVQLAGQVLGRSSPDGSTLALAAALNARAAVRIASSKTPGSDAASLAETYASNAILCLKEAHKKGAFPFEFQRTGLVTDPDLAGLQGQPEFVKLLSEIIGPSAAPQ